MHFTFNLTRPAGARSLAPGIIGRLAALLSLLAVAAALFAPVAMLAQDVRTGKLGGLCSVSAGDAPAAALIGGLAAEGNPSGPSQPAQSGGGHCDLCASLALALPVLAPALIPTFAGTELARSDAPAPAATVVTGLPFSRGPPFTL